jgi:hypothetical protein
MPRKLSDALSRNFVHSCGMVSLLNARMNIPYRGSQGPLHLLIDSTGIKAPSRPHPADAPAGQWRAKASGTPASTEAPSVVSGAKSTSLARQANGTFDERGN